MLSRNGPPTLDGASVLFCLPPPMEFGILGATQEERGTINEEMKTAWHMDGF